MDDLRKQSDKACVYESILNLHAILEIFQMKILDINCKKFCVIVQSGPVV